MGEEGGSAFRVAGWASQGRVHVSVPREVACWSRVSARDPSTPEAILLGDRRCFREVSEVWGGRDPRSERGGPPGWLPVDLGVGFGGGKHVPKREAHFGEGPAPIWRALGSAVAEGLWTDPRVDVVTYRNNLIKIATTILQARDPWRVRCCRFERTLVLDIVMLPERSWAGSDKFSYYGYKFESLATAPTAPAVVHEPVDETSEFNSVSRLRIGDYFIGMAAEIDGFRRQARPSATKNAAYVELKTCQAPDEVLGRWRWDPWWFAPGSEACRSSHQVERRARKFRREKLPKFWFQSYIAGTPEVCVGWRDGRGALQFCSSYGIHDLANVCEGEWSPWTMLGFVHDVLRWIDGAVGEAQCDCCADYNPGTRAIQFTADPASHVLREKLIHLPPLGAQPD